MTQGHDPNYADDPNICKTCEDEREGVTQLCLTHKGKDQPMRIASVDIRFSIDRHAINEPRALRDHKQIEEFTNELIEFVTAYTEQIRRLGVVVAINDQNGNNINIPVR